MVTAVVLSGGANLGAVQVGMLRALVEAGVRPDLIVGTSVGAVNGAYLSSRWDLEGVEGLAEVWKGMRRSEVFPTRLFGGFLGLIGKRNHLVPIDGLRGIVERYVEFDRLEDAPIPLYVVATNLLTGLDRPLSVGSSVEAVLASAAIPGVFPPIVIDQTPYIDGGVVNNTPISHALDLGADEIWVLPAGIACGLDEAPDSALAIVLQSVSLLVNRRLQRDIEVFQDDHDLRVVPPLCPLMVSPTDFGQAADLMARSYATTVAWLGSGSGSGSIPGDQAHLLTHPHHH